MNESINQLEVLLVEDNEEDAMLAIRSLKKSNLANHVLHVSDGEEALDYLFGRGKYINGNVSTPKLVLLDLRMPRISGIEVLRAIRADDRTRDIPVVILTSSKDEYDMNKCYELGANNYIVKPVGSENFLKTVRDLGFYWLVVHVPTDQVH